MLLLALFFARSILDDESYATILEETLFLFLLAIKYQINFKIVLLVFKLNYS